MLLQSELSSRVSTQQLSWLLKSLCKCVAFVQFSTQIIMLFIPVLVSRYDIAVWFPWALLYFWMHNVCSSESNDTECARNDEGWTCNYLSVGHNKLLISVCSPLGGYCNSSACCRSLGTEDTHRRSDEGINDWICQNGYVFPLMT